MIAPWRRRALAAAAGLLVDLRFGEPLMTPHPVAAFGSAMRSVEERTWADDRRAGAAHLAVGVSLAVAAGRLAPSTTMATALAVAGRSLGDEARAVGAAVAADDLDEARRRLPSLVGRDPSQLDAAAMLRAAVESVAENAVDAVVATALWGAVLGAPGAYGHRAVNTLDAMVGYRSDRYRRFGWASARADDLLAWVPARLTAALVAMVRPGRALDVARTVRRDAGGHPSPNGGVAESAFAAALGVSLGGTTNRYGDEVSHRPSMGAGPPPTAADLVRATVLLRDVTLALAGALVLAALLPTPRRSPTWSR